MKTQVKNAIEMLINSVEISGNTELVNQLKSKSEEIINAIPEDYITRASFYLSDEESIESQVSKIENYQDQEAYIDDIEGVCVWEPLEGQYTCEEFLELIGRYF